MSGLSDRYGARGRVGQLGEDYFDRSLKRAGLGQFQRFRSLAIPNHPGRPRMSGDIDHVIVNGNKVVLIDVKRWKGSVLWSAPAPTKHSAAHTRADRPMLAFSGLLPLGKDGVWTLTAWMSGSWKLSEWKLSANMSAALDRMQRALPGAEVSAMVVFVPTNDRDRESVPKSVAGLIWPGGIRSYLTGDTRFSSGAYRELFRRLGNEVEEVPATILHTLTGLKRHN